MEFGYGNFEGIPYRLGKNAEGQNLPLVLFLHGAGERGRDNRRQLNETMRPLVLRLNERPCIILAPQCPHNMQWVNTNWRNGSYTGVGVSLFMEKVLRLLEKTIEETHADKSRIYVAGPSMGGFGTWHIICQRPDLFAAALPFCGGADLTQLYKVKNIGIWTFHGDCDPEIPVTASREAVETLKNLGGKIRYTEYEGIEHGCYSVAYCERDLTDWLFSNKKEK